MYKSLIDKICTISSRTLFVHVACNSHPLDLRPARFHVVRWSANTQQHLGPEPTGAIELLLFLDSVSRRAERPRRHLADTPACGNLLPHHATLLSCSNDNEEANLFVFSLSGALAAMLFVAAWVTNRDIDVCPSFMNHKED